RWRGRGSGGGALRAVWGRSHEWGGPDLETREGLSGQQVSQAGCHQACHDSRRRRGFGINRSKTCRAQGGGPTGKKAAIMALGNTRALITFLDAMHLMFARVSL